MRTNPRLSDAARAALTFSAQLGHKPLAQSTLAEARTAFAVTARACQGAAEAVASILDGTIPARGGPLPIRHYRGHGAPAEAAPAIVYFHGGGWVLGGLDSHDAICRWLANAMRSAVISVNYRLAPEHAFPAGLSDAADAIRYVHGRAREMGIDPRRLMVAGDSAGGNLAAVAALLSRDGDLPSLAAQILIYPNTDLLADFPSRRLFAEGYGLTASEMAWFTKHYAGRHDKADWRLSPLRAPSLRGLPKTILVIADLDLLADEGLAYGEAIRAAGGTVTVLRYPDLIHGFASMGRFFPQARALAWDIAAILKDGLD